MRIVLDTNVIVSGLLNPRGTPGTIVRLVTTGKLSLCLDARIITEYGEVLSRSKFSFHPNLVAALLHNIDYAGIRVTGLPLPGALPDARDEPFLEAALAGRAKYLITGNLKHFPEDLRQMMAVVSPAEFLELYRSGLSN